MPHGNLCKGFTLVELLISMALFAIVTGAIYSTHLMQRKSYLAQEQIAALQQNLRAAIYHMGRDIRMAGYDPTGDTNATILTAHRAELIFQVDANGDGDFSEADGSPDTNERIRYALSNDSNRDGIANGSSCHLGRESWDGHLQRVSENIDALNFVYLDENGSVLNPGLTHVPAANLASIRVVEITVVARSERMDKDVTDGRDHRNLRGEIILPARNDHYRRKTQWAVVKCRNLGL